jgi:GDP-L-fucose synthase
MKTLIIRPGNLYGPFDKFGLKESKVIASLVRKAVEGKFPLEVWGDGEEIKDFIKGKKDTTNIANYITD